VIAGNPAGGARVTLERGVVTSAHDEGEGADTTPVFRPDLDSVQKSATDAEGRFHLEGLTLGTYRLVLSAPSGESLAVVPVQARSKGDKDLGTLELLRGATITGSVLVPAGRSRSGLVVFLDEPRAAVKQTCDVEGRFRFEGVTAGKHSLTVDEVPGQLAEGATAQVTLAAGETREVVIDARDRGTCKVTLTIEIPGYSVEGLQVMLLPVAQPGKWIRLGETDAKGRVSGSALAAGDAGIRVVLPGGPLPRHPSAVVALVIDRDVEATLRYEVGHVRIELPASVQLPEKGYAKLGPKVESENFPTLWAQLGTEAKRYSSLDLEGDGRHFLASFVLAGDFDADFTILSEDALHETHELYRAPIHALVRAGETTDVRLP
jgi:hypothetical protein